MAQVRDLMGDAPVYITLDIDAIDPGYAPGTGRCVTLFTSVFIAFINPFTAKDGWNFASSNTENQIAPHESIAKERSFERLLLWFFYGPFDWILTQAWLRTVIKSSLFVTSKKYNEWFKRESKRRVNHSYMINRTRVVLTDAVTVLTTRASVTFPPYLIEDCKT